MNQIIVKEEANCRIDSYLAQNQKISRVTVQRLLENGKILVNGKSVKPSYKYKRTIVFKLKKKNQKKCL